MYSRSDDMKRRIKGLEIVNGRYRRKGNSGTSFLRSCYEILLILICRIRESVVKFEERDIWINQGFICKVQKEEKVLW